MHNLFDHPRKILIDNIVKQIQLLKGDPLLISVMIEYPPADISKLTNQIAKEKKNLQFSIHFTNGQIRNVHLMFSCDQQTAKGRIS